MMDPNDVAHLLNQARIKLPGASDAGLKIELFDVLQEFLADSNAWVEHIKFQATAGKSHYNLIPRYEGQIIRLIGVVDHNRVPVAGFMPEFGELHLQTPPNSTPPAPWTAAVIKNVVRPVTSKDIPIAPKFALRVYGVQILDGLLGKMMGEQAKSYSSETKSTYHLRRFRTGIQVARTAATRQNLLGAQAWSFPRGWSSHGQRGGQVSAFPPETF